jgi:(heptosyl)LPS beta-1,4-glucosyltransferase
LKLSSIIIAKNEAANIQRCIKSQLNCIDEIIILVDRSSSDKTLEIAKSFSSAKVEITEWRGFAETKQYGVSLTINDWVLWIDADEAISPELELELLEFKNSIPAFPAYSISRKAYFLGKWIKHSGWYPGRVTRLFNKNEVSFNKNLVHEQLDVKVNTGKLNNNLEHYTDPTIHHYFEKYNRYTSLAAEELYAKNKKFAVTDILIRPVVIFIKMYLLKAGFLDGVHGFILAILSSSYVFTKYSKLWELERSKNK